MSEQLDNGLEPISEEEERSYEACVHLIRRGISFYFEVGSCLLEIYERRLYRSRFSSFEKFLKYECEIEGHALHYSYARKLMAGASVTQNLITAAKHVEQVDETVTNGDSFPLPTNERQVRPLIGLEPEEQVQAWETAVERNGGKVPSGAVVQSVVTAYKEEIRPDRKNEEPESLKANPEYKPKKPMQGTWFKCVSGTLEQRGNWIWLQIFNPSTQKEFPFAFPVKELTSQGWTPPAGMPDEIDGEPLLDPSTANYLLQQTTKAEANKKRIEEGKSSVVDEFFGEIPLQ